MIGGIAETQEMLDFCAEHDVRPEIEVITPDYINEAYERVLASDVRYRFVIDTATAAADFHVGLLGDLESLKIRDSSCSLDRPSAHPTEYGPCP